MLGLLPRLLRVVRLLLETHLRIARSESEREAERLVRGLLLGLAAGLLLGCAVVVGQAALAALLLLIGWTPAAALGALAGADVLLALVLGLAARRKLAGPWWVETRELLGKTARVLEER